ncbi:MAG: peptidase MA domain-containing protein [Chloroflexi bacterium]|nr:peptidase MA domain-containing protein [Chloroflexota bacterium]
MIKKISIFASVIALCLVLLSPVLVRAQSGLTVTKTSVEAGFPLKLNFNLSAKSDANITDIRLHYTVDHDSYAEVVSEAFVEFAPADTVEVQWTWDMRRTGGLPPGTNVEYWWTVKDAKGGVTDTAPAKLQFDDNRYSWKSLTDGKVTIYWYQGEQSFASEVMLASQQALARLTQNTGAYLKKPVKIYIYNSAQDLQGAMIFPQEWTGGVTYSRYGIIAIGIAPNNLSWGRRAIAHELTHLVVHQMTFNPYNELPTWLDEGLAMYAEGELEPDYTSLLNKAIADKSLISVRSLTSPFSAYANAASLSYAESYSLVAFLVGNYGQDKMLALLNIFNEASSYDGAFSRIYGFDMDGLNTLWQADAIKQYQPAGSKSAMSPVPGRSLAGVFGGFLFDLRLFSHSSVKALAW